MVWCCANPQCFILAAKRWLLIPRYLWTDITENVICYKQMQMKKIHTCSSGGVRIHPWLLFSLHAHVLATWLTTGLNGQWDHVLNGNLHSVGYCMASQIWYWFESRRMSISIMVHSTRRTSIINVNSDHLVLTGINRASSLANPRNWRE